MYFCSYFRFCFNVIYLAKKIKCKDILGVILKKKNLKLTGAGINVGVLYHLFYLLFAFVLI